MDAPENCRATGRCLMGRLGVLGLVELQVVLGRLGLAELSGLSGYALGRLLSIPLDAPGGVGGGPRCGGV